MSNSAKSNQELLYDYLVNHNRESYEQLVTNNLNLVHHTIQKFFYKSSLTFNRVDEEFFSAGCAGLIRAIETFDITKIDSVSFSTYATYCIIGAITKEKRNKNKNLVATVSFDYKVPGEREQVLLHELVGEEYSDIDRFIDEDYREYKKKKIMEVINKLHERDRNIVLDYFGFNGKRMNQKQLAEKYGMSQSSICWIIDGIKTYLQRHLSEFKEDYGGGKIKEKTRSSVYNAKENINNIDRNIYLEFNCTLTELDNALLKLSSKEKKLIDLYYGLSDGEPKQLQEIQEITGINYNNLASAIFAARGKIKKFIENPDLVVLKGRKKHDIIKEIMKSYDKDLVEEAISHLTEDEIKFLEMYYGYNDCKIKSKEEICTIIDLDETSIYNMPAAIKRRILKNIDKIIRKRKELDFINDLYKKHGQISVDKAISQLKENQKQCIILLYGLSDGKRKDIDQISKIFNVDSKVIFSTIRKGKRNLLLIIEKNKEKENLVKKMR